VKTALFYLFCSAWLLFGTEDTLVWRDPGPIERLDLAAGPEGTANAPKAPFTFVKDQKGGTSPKIVITDARGKKWMVKFGQEAKPETFASRMAWAAGYPTRTSYYVGNGRIEGAGRAQGTSHFIGSDGSFQGARFQVFDNEHFREIANSKLDLNNKREDQRELNGLKLLLLLLSNWDVKKQNTGIFEIDGRQYAIVTDWGASLGDAASPDVATRKWNCPAFDKRSDTLIEGSGGGYVAFNYTQYAARHEHALSEGIRVADLDWFMSRMGKLTDAQIHAALLASGATQDEGDCFTRAIRRRMNLFTTAAHGGHLK
jgi:hypothetical protein